MRSQFRCSQHAFVALSFLLFSALSTMAETENSNTVVRGYDLSRIVSIGGDVTEILYDLGLENNIVAIDTTSQHPDRALKTKRNIGYMRALSSEGVLSMKPTIIIASNGAGPPEVVAALKSTSIPYVAISEKAKPDAVLLKIQQIADATGRQAQGRALSRQVEKALERVSKKLRATQTKSRGLFVLLARNGRAMVGGQQTAADELFKLAGLENAASEMKGFRPVSNESVLAMKPDIVITMRRSKEQSGEQKTAVGAVEGLRQTEAVKQGRIIEIDGAYMLNFGPRIAQAAEVLAEKVQLALEGRDAPVTQ